MVYSTDRSKAVVPVLVSCFVVHSTRRFVLSLVLCYFVLMLFSPFIIAITSLGEERANFSAFRTFVRFGLAWFCLFSLPLGVWEGLRLVIVALPGLSAYLFGKQREHKRTKLEVSASLRLFIWQQCRFQGCIHP